MHIRMTKNSADKYEDHFQFAFRPDDFLLEKKPKVSSTCNYFHSIYNEDISDTRVNKDIKQPYNYSATEDCLSSDPGFKKAMPL